MEEGRDQMSSIGALATRRATTSTSPARRAVSPGRRGTGPLMAPRQKMGTTADAKRPTTPVRPPAGTAGPRVSSPPRGHSAGAPAARSTGQSGGRSPQTPRTPSTKPAESEVQERKRLVTELPEVREREQEVAENEQASAAQPTPRSGVEEAASPALPRVASSDDMALPDESERARRVVCPPGAEAGATIILDGLHSADGRQVEVVIPPNVNPGEEFEVMLPDVQAAGEPDPEPKPVAPKAGPLTDGQSPVFRVAVTKGDSGSFGILIDNDDSGQCILDRILDFNGPAGHAGLLACVGWKITHLGGQPCRTAQKARDILTAASANKPVEFVLIHPDAPAAAIDSDSSKPKRDWSARCWSCCCSYCAGVVWMLLLLVLPSMLLMSSGRIAFAEHETIISSIATVFAGCILLLHLAIATAVCGNRCRTLLCAWGVLLFGLGAACYGFVHLITTGLEYEIPVPVKSVAPNVAIIGAGTEGLAAAWMLQTAGTKFTLVAEGDTFDDAARLVSFAPPGRPAPVQVDTSLSMLNPEDMDLAKIFGGYYSYSDAANQDGSIAVRRIAPSVGAPTAEEDLNQEIDLFNAVALEDASDPDIVLWSLEYWLWYHDFSDEFQAQVLEPALHAFYLTQGAVPTLRGPAIAYIRPFATGAWSLRGAGRLATYEQQGVLGAGLLTAKHTERLGDRPLAKGASLTNSPLIDVLKSSSGYRVRAGTGLDAKFDAVIINLDADVVADKVVAVGYFARWALSQVRYASLRFKLHSDATPEIEAARLLARPARPSVFYSGDASEGKVWEGSRVADSSSSVTFDVCTLNAPDHMCTGDRETLATFERSPTTASVSDADLGEFEDLRRYRILDAWSVFFSVAVFPRFQGDEGLWYAGSWCVDLPRLVLPVR